MTVLTFVILPMMIDLLIDTNVLIYAMDEESMYSQIAQKILLDSNHNLFITSKNISEFFAVTSKKKVAPEISLDKYFQIKTVSTILFPSEGSLSILENLIRDYQPKGNQVFDHEIVSIMLANGINHIATFNQKDFMNISEVQILPT